MTAIEELLEAHVDRFDAAIRGYLDGVAAGESDPEHPEYGPLSMWPTSVVNLPGHPYAVILSDAAPHIEVSAHGSFPARLVGNMGAATTTRSGKHLDAFIDLFINR